MRALVLVVALTVASSASAAPLVAGSKLPGCALLQNRLARRELLPTTKPQAARRLERLRRRVADDCVALNEVQTLGTHNSYHIQPAPDLFSVLVAFDSQFRLVEYTHIPLDQQFDTEGIRQIEIDVFADPNGGLYARRGVEAARPRQRLRCALCVRRPCAGRRAGDCGRSPLQSASARRRRTQRSTGLTAGWHTVTVRGSLPTPDIPTPSHFSARSRKVNDCVTPWSGLPSTSTYG